MALGSKSMSTKSPLPFKSRSFFFHRIFTSMTPKGIPNLASKNLSLKWTSPARSYYADLSRGKLRCGAQRKARPTEILRCKFSLPKVNRVFINSGKLSPRSQIQMLIRGVNETEIPIEPKRPPNPSPITARHNVHQLIQTIIPLFGKSTATNTVPVIKSFDARGDGSRPGRTARINNPAGCHLIRLTIDWLENPVAAF